MNKDSLFSTIKSMGEFASKDLGQNFLIDPDTCEKIVSFLEIEKEDNVLEVGAGYGALSYFLVNSNASITLDDVDERSIEFLNNTFKENKNVQIIKESALNIESDKYTKVIGNLPYYITNSLLESLLYQLDGVKKYVFMIQKEVFDRVNAKMNSENYGPLSVLMSTLGTCKKEIIVHRDMFTPMPHVDSLVFSLTITTNYKSEEKYAFLQFLKKLFLHRRKTIQKNLTLALGNSNKAIGALNEIGVPLNYRPEQIAPEQYFKLFKIIN